MTVAAAVPRSRRRRLLLPSLLVAAWAAAAAADVRAQPQPDAPAPARTPASAPPALPEPGDRQQPATVAAVAHPQVANARVVALRHSADGLRKTYLDPRGRRKAGMQLPRIIVFNREGRLLGGQAGFRTGDMRHLRRLVHLDRPFPRAASLDDTLAELETPDGAPVQQADLPAADVFLVVYRSAVCERCDRLDAELAVVAGGLHRHRFIWLAVDSDPAQIRIDVAPSR